MSFFSEERASELRELFFESASELLQVLNEEGLELEKHPDDAEVIRRARRTVHTLKGDSAAAGFLEMSGLAHELEDVLSLDVSQIKTASLADLVLRVADAFGEMLAIYRRGHKPEPQEALLALIRKLAPAAARSHGSPVAARGTAVPYKLTGRFAWNEYELLAIADAAAKGERVYNIAVALDQSSPSGIALQIVKNTLEKAGRVLAMFPEKASSTIDVVEAALASSAAEAKLLKLCRIPTITTDVVIERVAAAATIAGSDSVLELDEQAQPARFSRPAGSALEGANSELSARLGAPENILRVDAERIDAVLNLVGELIIGKSMLMQNVNDFERRFAKDPLGSKFADVVALQARILNDLQKSVMKIRMVPVEQLFRRFPRVVRDVALACGKEVELDFAGETTDLDKSILDVLAEPLSHLVRNAVDHGVEKPEAREAAGKPRRGTVRLNAYHLGNQIVIECSDDGQGIDREKLLSKAIARGLVNPADAAQMSEAEALSLVFHPGLSTADQVTAVSGRGVGMDVVKTVIESLKGSVSIESNIGRGTTFRLKVPLTLAIIKAMMFRSGSRTYAIPLVSVVEITRAQESDVHRVNDYEALQLRGEVLTLVRMSKLSGASGPQSSKLFVLVVAHADRKFGLVVDRLVGEEELVIKALDDPLVATEFVSGASILGDGSVVLILNLPTVIGKLSRNIPVAVGASA